MQVHIDRNGERYGPYSIEDINAYLANGTLLPTDVAWQDGMTDWVPITQISGVVMPGDSVATPAPPSQPVPNGNKKKILIGIGAGMGLLALMAGIWFFFIRPGGEKGQLAINDENNRTAIGDKGKDSNKPRIITMAMMREIVQILETKLGEKFPEDPEGKFLAGFLDELNQAIKDGKLKPEPFTAEAIAAAFTKRQKEAQARTEARKIRRGSFEWLKARAEKGWAPAQNDLGAMYAKGQEVEKDYKEAAKWYRKAAEQNNPVAQLNLGRAYINAQGVEKDRKEAIKWFRAAAEQGFFKAQWSLGVAYDYGTGVVRDNVTAFAWYTLAIANGDVKSKKHKTDLAKKMTPEQIAEGEALIKEMIQENQKLMNKDAIFNRLPK